MDSHAVRIPKPLSALRENAVASSYQDLRGVPQQNDYHEHHARGILVVTPSTLPIMPAPVAMWSSSWFMIRKEYWSARFRAFFREWTLCFVLVVATRGWAASCLQHLQHGYM